VTATAALVSKNDFEHLEGVVHLSAGGETPPLKSQREALLRFYDDKGRAPGLGGTPAELKSGTYRRAKEYAATLLGLPADDIAFASSVAEAMSQVALSLPLGAGDTIVVEDMEFGSAILPWVRLKDRGVELRVIKHLDFNAEETAFAGAVDTTTRVIVTSQVGYMTGIQHNMQRLRAIADSVGALLVSDASHAAGAVRVPGDLCDFTISACYKWLLGCTGVALLGWNRQRVPELRPAIVGWRTVVGLDRPDATDLTPKQTAEALEPGNPPWPSVFFLEDGLRYLTSVGLDRIDPYVMGLSDRMNAGLRRLGLAVATPAERASRAGNNCFWWDNPEDLARRLAERRILVSGYSGRIRVSTHLYNDESDVDTCLNALEELTRQR
jgi:cysteine desulfurase/selenocysteine lyase